MSDSRIRNLERLAHGNPEALAGLVRSLERAGDQESLCRLGLHDVELIGSAPVAQNLLFMCRKLGCDTRRDCEPSDCNPDTYGTWCHGCQTAVPVNWVSSPPPRPHPHFFDMLPSPAAGGRITDLLQ